MDSLLAAPDSCYKRLMNRDLAGFCGFGGRCSLNGARKMKIYALSNTSIALLVFLTGVMGVLPACTQIPVQGGADVTPPESSMGLLRATQIIIKFRDPALVPSQSHFMKEISRDAGAALIYVRPMSGGAHVLRLENPADSPELSRIIERLGKRPDVEYVEPDRPMQHM